MKKQVFLTVCSMVFMVGALVLTSCENEPIADQEELHTDSPGGDEHEEPTRDN